MFGNMARRGQIREQPTFAQSRHVQIDSRDGATSAAVPEPLATEAEGEDAEHASDDLVEAAKGVEAKFGQGH